MSALVIPFPVGLRLDAIKTRMALARSMPSLAAIAASVERRAYIVGYMDATMNIHGVPIDKPTKKPRSTAKKA